MTKLYPRWFADMHGLPPYEPTRMSTYLRVDDADVHWIQHINADAKTCEIDGPLWKGSFDITAEAECNAGSLEAAIRHRLKMMTTRGDPALRWYFNYPEYGHAVENTSDRELSYDVGAGERIKIGPGEVHALVKPTKWVTEPSGELVGGLVIRPDYEGRSPFVILYENTKPSEPKVYKRIANIGRY